MKHLLVRRSFNLSGVSPGFGELHQEVKWDLQEAIFYEEAFREELRTQELKVAKMEELQPRDTGDLSGTEGQ